MSFYPYKLNIPSASNNPSSDQPDMQTNTNSVNGLISIDHVGFGENTGGWHKVVHFTAQEGTPAPTAGGLLYTQLNDGQMALFFKSQTGVVTPLTNTVRVNVNNGYIVLPTGLLMQWGQYTTLSQVSSNFPFPFSSTPYSIMLTGTSFFSSDYTLTVKTPLNSTSFTPLIFRNGSEVTSGSAPTFMMFAIGPS